jgi:predicted ester cyclase
MEINEQIAEGDLDTPRRTLRGTHPGEHWDRAPRRVEFEFMAVIRVVDGRLIEPWISIDFGALQPDAARS